MDPITSASAILAIDKLNERCQQMATLLRRSKMKVIRCYSVPLRKQVEVPDSIEVEKLEGYEAREVAIAGITQIMRSQDQCRKETFRVPGVLWLEPEMKEPLEALIREKEDLYSMMRCLDRNESHAVKRMQPLCSLLQAYRIPEVVINPKRIRFYWDTGYTTKQVDAASVREILLNRYQDLTDNKLTSWKNMPSHPESTQEYQLCQDLMAISHIEDREVLCIRRPKQPHPRARITTGDHWHIAQANVPIVVFGDPSLSIKIVDGDLMLWEGSSQAISNSSRYEISALIEHLSLFRYTRGHRKYETDGSSSTRVRKSSSYISKLLVA